MKIVNFVEKLNFSQSPENSNAIEIRKWHNTNFYETLCQYCSDHNINTNSVDDMEFMSAVQIMAEYAQSDKSTDSYYFWID